MVFLPLSTKVLPWSFLTVPASTFWGYPKSLDNVKFVSRSSVDGKEDRG